MRKGFCLFCLIFFFQLLYPQRSTRIAYVDMEYILENIEEYQLAMKEIAIKAENWKKDIQQKQRDIDNLKESLNYEKILLTKELIEEREYKIRFYENELFDYQQKRFGTNGDYIIQQQKIIQPLQDKVSYAIRQIAKEKKYDIIFDKSADVVMLYTNKRLDITRQILQRIKTAMSREKIKQKGKIKKQDFSKKDSVLEQKVNQQTKKPFIDLKKDVKLDEFIKKDSIFAPDKIKK